MEEYKTINLKELNTNQKEVVRHINAEIINHQTVFHKQPDELVISTREFNSFLTEEEIDLNYKYLLLGKIKIYKV